MIRSVFASKLGDACDRGRRTGNGSWTPGRSHVLLDGHRSLYRAGIGTVLVAALCLLTGCVESHMGAQAPQAPSPEASTNIGRRPGVSPAGATVAVVSFAGAPDALRDRFSQAFDAAAKTQDIVMTSPDGAEYLVRGYLNAVPEEEGTAVSYVLDVFDAKKHRTQRISDDVFVQAKAADPWSVVDDRVLTAVATKSAAGLAAVMTNTPQAIAAARTQPASTETATAQPDDRTVVAATPPVGQSPGGQTSTVALQH
jgi:hypothetical protein